MDVTGGGGLVAAAGPLAVLVPQPDRVPDARGDGVGVADVQRQARSAQHRLELLAAQERGESAWAGQQLDGLADDGLLQQFPGPAGAEDNGRIGAGGHIRQTAVRVAVTGSAASRPAVAAPAVAAPAV